MGRVAGDSIATIRRRMWKERVAETRDRKAYWGMPTPQPLCSPGAARRQMAMLWWIDKDCNGSLHIGGRGAPPLTADMRVLLAKGYLKLQRVASYMALSPSRRHNKLTVTPLAKSVLAKAAVPDADKAYIIAASKSASFR